jgi:16S rRNA (cytosine1407-C5)-methyltransferase
LMGFLPSRRSFRLVCGPEHTKPVEDLLRAEGYAFSPEAFSPLCRRLEYEPRPLGASLAAFFGYIYIQDRSSMLPPLALAPDSGEFVLDMCASPGGKSVFLAQLTGATGFVLANEPDGERLATLRANLLAANLPQAITSAYPGQSMPLPPRFCKAVLLDAPCSGWGTARKHPEVLKFWRADKVGGLTALQRRLLAAAAVLLAPGGALVYSTCTTNQQENEDQLRFAEEVLGLERETLTPFPGFVFEERAGGAGALRVDGDKSEAQGFFVARLRKPAAGAPAVFGEAGADGPVLPVKSGRERAAEQTLAPESLAGDCCDPARLPPGRIVRRGEQVRFLPAKAVSALPANFVRQGMLLGRMAAGRFRPSPRLRFLLPDPADRGNCLALDDLKDITALLRGQSRQTGLAGGQAGLWWRGLPLCLVRLARGRATAAF